MLLIFGLSEKRELLAVLRYRCESCGNEAAHQLVERLRRFSIFFIPLVPLGSRFEDVCMWCSRTLSVTREQAIDAAQGRGPGQLV